MTISRFALVLAVGIVLQAGVFAWRYSDLLYFSRPVHTIVTGGPDRFATHATDALARPRVTLRHLDTIADVAARLDQDMFERHALERRLEVTPEDERTRLRLAAVLTRAGDTKGAEQLYLDVLRASGRETP